MSKILVTGSNGQLGSELRKLAIKNTQHEFLFTDVEELNICSVDEVEQMMADFRPDVLVNCAAYTQVDRAEDDVVGCYKLNAKAPGICAAACKKFGAKFIHVSTDYVFDGVGCRPYIESDEVNPQSVYGKSKLVGESKILEVLPEAIIVRTSWLYSSFGGNFVKTMIRLGEEREQLNVVFDQVGTPTYAGDLADAILNMIVSLKDDENQAGIYHYSNEGVCSWYDFALAIHEEAGVECNVYPVESKEFPVKATRPSYSVLNKNKIKQNFGLIIPHWRESLKLCIQEIKQS
ncbi:dTDP-4-dehydrorhamnose reductase [Puteibacter caeruleilacunae]|nr:dTDP-4-dehydrorhamnose reductase [Puteibacter caeruleilacunae]